MEKKPTENVLESLFEKTSDYVETRLELTKYKAIKKTAVITSSLISKLVVGALLLSFVMILNIAVGLWLGELLHKTYLGFFALAGFYFVAGLITFRFRDKWLKNPIADSIIDKMAD
ncbi:phage holin family protein [Ferruginibacter yonginensis]|uniref:Phage holin family protein n=1 Tax=Ferruginibacter yonginensis TaxID=1310416 RepID=A0ABV8QTK9_9BACT